MIESTTVALILLMLPDGTPTPYWTDSVWVMPLVSPSLGVPDVQQFRTHGTLWQDYLNQARRDVRYVDSLPSLDALARMPDADICIARSGVTCGVAMFCDEVLLRKEGTPWPEERWKWVRLRDHYKNLTELYALMHYVRQPGPEQLRQSPSATPVGVRQRREYLQKIKEQVGDERFFYGDWPDWLPIWENKNGR